MARLYEGGDGGAPASAEKSFLLRELRGFYSEVLSWRERIERAGVDPGALNGEGGGPGEEAGGSGGAVVLGRGVDPLEVGQHLERRLERFVTAASRSAGAPPAEVASEARYAMAALADEVFLNLDWHGREYWAANLLESRLYRTHRAGERIFERIEALLASPELGRVDLAKVYLMTLGLGFEGRYRADPDGHQHRSAYARALHHYVTTRDSDAGGALLSAGDEAAARGRGARLPHVRPWVWAALGLVLVWLIVSHFLWRSLIDEIPL